MAFFNKLQIQLINIELRKNKVFFAGAFGFASFYFYIFIGKGAGWGEAGWCKRLCQLLMFSAGGETTYNNYFYQAGRLLPSFFLYLAVVFFCHYNKPAFEFNLKTGN